MPDLADIRDDLDDIRAALGGPDGVQVRLAVLEQRIAGIEVGLKEHRQQSTDNHASLVTAVESIKSAPAWRISIDPASGRALGAFLGAVLAALAAGGGIATALGQGAASTTGSAQHSAPALPSVPDPTP